MLRGRTTIKSTFFIIASCFLFLFHMLKLGEPLNSVSSVLQNLAFYSLIGIIIGLSLSEERGLLYFLLVYLLLSSVGIPIIEVFFGDDALSLAPRGGYLFSLLAAVILIIVVDEFVSLKYEAYIRNSSVLISLIALVRTVFSFILVLSIVITHVGFKRAIVLSILPWGYAFFMQIILLVASLKNMKKL